MIGFFASAPLAWPYLTDQAETGDFARGVGVFFLVIATGALVSGALGLALGTAIGWGWERVHRHRRRRAGGPGGRDDEPTAPRAGSSSFPPSSSSPPSSARPAIAGRPLESITWRAGVIELGFGSAMIRAPVDAVIGRGDRAARLSESAGREMLHALIGERVRLEPSAAGGETVDLLFANGAVIRGLPCPARQPEERPAGV